MGVETPYIPRDDESEAKRLKDIHGVGEVILDPDDVRGYSLVDFGMGVDPSDYR